MYGDQSREFECVILKLVNFFPRSTTVKVHI